MVNTDGVIFLLAEVFYKLNVQPKAAFSVLSKTIKSPNDQF